MGETVLQQINSKPHRRHNPLRDEWVLVSPQRTQRPWQGQVEERPPEVRSPFDPSCYLCPGNHRVGGVQNPDYTGTFVYENDFPALLPDTEPVAMADGLLEARTERGICRVICYSPRHDLTLAELSRVDLRRLVDLWAEQTSELGSLSFATHVQVFENRGAMMGSSNPHPHGQIWVNETLPEEARRELRCQSDYLTANGSCLLCDYLSQEVASRERIVCENDHFVAVVPFWATWPFETMLLSRRHVRSLPDLTSVERDALADIAKRLTTRYDNLFRVSFPYTMGFHQAPTDDLDVGAHPEWHLHAHFYPPLLRSATVRKFMVGYEMLANAQRDVTPEQAADQLRGLSELHYREQAGS